MDGLFWVGGSSETDLTSSSRRFPARYETNVHLRAGETSQQVRVGVWNNKIQCLTFCPPSGPELVSQLHRSQSRVQPAAGFPVVPVGPARQLATPPDLAAGAQ